MQAESKIDKAKALYEKIIQIQPDYLNALITSARSVSTKKTWIRLKLTLKNAWNMIQILTTLLRTLKR
jgi:hypothetical protein